MNQPNETATSIENAVKARLADVGATTASEQLDKWAADKRQTRIVSQPRPIAHALDDTRVAFVGEGVAAPYRVVAVYDDGTVVLGRELSDGSTAWIAYAKLDALREWTQADTTAWLTSCAANVDRLNQARYAAMNAEHAYRRTLGAG